MLKAPGLECCHLVPSPTCIPISKALPSYSLSSERPKPPLIGVIDFFVPNPSPAVLMEKLKVIHLFFFFFN